MLQYTVARLKLKKEVSWRGRIVRVPGGTRSLRNLPTSPDYARSTRHRHRSSWRPPGVDKSRRFATTSAAKRRVLPDLVTAFHCTTTLSRQHHLIFCLRRKRSARATPATSSHALGTTESSDSVSLVPNLRKIDLYPWYYHPEDPLTYSKSFMRSYTTRINSIRDRSITRNMHRLVSTKSSTSHLDCLRNHYKKQCKRFKDRSFP